MGDREVELKLVLDSLAEMERLREALGPRVTRLEQSNFYFDTADDALARHRWALRCRNEDGRIILTLKGEGHHEDGFAVRVELERPLSDAAWVGIVRGEFDLASEIASLLAESEHSLPADVDLQTLETIGSISNVRSVHRLPGQGAPLMVDLDETEYPDFSLAYEVELEVPEDEDRKKAADRLRAVFEQAGVAWRPSETTKYARLRKLLEEMSARA
ncbi:MAG: CYTH domain-containing protein [Myxococcota bacterium]